METDTEHLYKLIVDLEKRTKDLEATIYWYTTLTKALAKINRASQGEAIKLSTSEKAAAIASDVFHNWDGCSHGAHRVGPVKLGLRKSGELFIM